MWPSREWYQRQCRTLTRQCARIRRPSPRQALHHQQHRLPGQHARGTPRGCTATPSRRAHRHMASILLVLQSRARSVEDHFAQAGQATHCAYILPEATSKPWAGKINNNMQGRRWPRGNHGKSLMQQCRFSSDTTSWESARPTLEALNSAKAMSLRCPCPPP